MRIKLYEQDGATRVHIDASVTGEGDVQVAGHDIGEAPQKWWGHDDYEYIVTIRKKDKDRLLRALTEEKKADDEASPLIKAIRKKDRLLLNLIREKFGDDASAVSHFRTFAQDKNIPHEWFTWP